MCNLYQSDMLRNTQFIISLGYRSLYYNYKGIKWEQAQRVNQLIKWERAQRVNHLISL